MTRPEEFLPLTAPVYHVLLALGDRALHGYGMMDAIDRKTDREDSLLPGTLYATLHRMVEQGLIESLDEPPEPGADRRRRYYRATSLGREVASAESRRLRRLLRIAEDAGYLAGGEAG